MTRTMYFTGHGITLYIDYWYDMLYRVLRHIYVPLVHRSTNARTAAFHIIVIIVIWMLDTQLCHVYTSRFHLTLVLHVHKALWYLFTSIHAWLVFIFLSSGFLFILHVLLFHVTVFMLYACFPLLILLLPLLDTWAVDMRYVDSHIYCFPFPVIVFRTINRAHVMLLYYM